MNRKLFSLVFLFLFLLPVLRVEAGWKEQLLGLAKPLEKKSLADTQIGQGLKEALSLGIDKAVAQASAEGGYYNNNLIKIRFPEQLSLVEKSLRKIGKGAMIDNFEKSVNSAAEAAAPQAKGILLDALFGMSFEDAKGLLNGGDTAATNYFRSKTSDRLSEAFSPYIKKAMDQYGVSQKYNQVIQLYNRIPLASKPKLVSAEQYATAKALDGLFALISEQEKAIRTNPQARVTDLLKTVFAKKS